MAEMAKFRKAENPSGRNCLELVVGEGQFYWPMGGRSDRGETQNRKMGKIKSENITEIARKYSKS